MKKEITDILHKTNNWQDFKTHVRFLKEKEKGDCFESLVKYFLQLHPNYATKLKNIWYLRSVPPKVRKYLNLPVSDEGIDLIAETGEGEYWSVQCKYREDEIKSLPRKDLATFTDLTFGICRNFALALVCTTADRYSHRLKLYGDRISFVCGDKWRGLGPDFFRQLHNLIEGKKTLPKPLRPRPHQQKAIRNAYKHFVKGGNSRGKLIMPCGTGKSLAAFLIAEKLGARSILIAVPSLALIRQTLEVWAKESLARQKNIHWICVCSDETVSRFEKDDLAVLTQDLGVRVHTDENEIADWLRKKKQGIKVVLTTYQSGRVIASAANKAKRVFDIGVMDEAHKTVGKKDALFNHLLHDHNIKVSRRLFMTATERRYAGTSEHIVSMDDLDLYGDTFELLTFKEALECKPPILSDYRIVTVLVTRDEVADLIEKNLFVKPDRGNWDEEVEAKMLACTVALRKAIKKHNIKHSVSFHSSIARAKAFKDIQDRFEDSFPGYGKLDTYHVSGKTPTAVRSRRIDEFKAARSSLITNAQCLTEGVDIPDIDCVLFADPKRSTVNIVQAVGRALRRAEGKKRGYVVVPVEIGDESGANPNTQSGDFDAVLTILRALAANDERIIEYFRSISRGRRPARGTSPVDFDMPIGLAINADDFASSIELMFWSRLAKLSWRPFEEAREFTRSLNLKSLSEWNRFRKDEMPEKGTRPKDIPTNPNVIYHGKGWVNWGDFLGTGRIADQLRVYRPFENAREFARGLGLKSKAEWDRFCRGEMPEKGTLPTDIPLAPDVGLNYKGEGWVSWGDWLGTETIATFLKVYRPFPQAREFARSLGLRSMAEWKSFCNGQMPEKGLKPDDIPNKPNATYQDKDWISWGDWLGTGTVAPMMREYRPFRLAREYARSLGLKSISEWVSFCKGRMPEKGRLPEDIPRAADRTYRKKGWISWGDWLGTERVTEFRPFNEAREFARSLGLRSHIEWLFFCQGKMPEKGTRPKDIPAGPEQTYKNKGWKSWGDWLGTGRIADRLREFRSFEEAREFARGLNLRSFTEWRTYSRGEMPEKGVRPEDIPGSPAKAYKGKGWVSWGDWLGTGIPPRPRRTRPFKEARQFARSLGLRSMAEWKSFCNGQMSEKGTLPEDIPRAPQQAYTRRGEWINWADWLGKEV